MVDLLPRKKNSTTFPKCSNELGNTKGTIGWKWRPGGPGYFSTAKLITSRTSCNVSFEESHFRQPVVQFDLLLYSRGLPESVAPRGGFEGGGSVPPLPSQPLYRSMKPLGKGCSCWKRLEGLVFQKKEFGVMTFFWLWKKTNLNPFDLLLNETTFPAEA